MNRLAKQTSPYLLQHAHNPVDWFPWGDEAFEKARKEDLPLLVSIGYSACHWCHVMERESFEDPATAEIMNRNFVNVKIDREERPDLDHIYMDAVQAIAGNGGWPLNVFLTPEGKPFYGGTYFPPVNAYNRPSWTNLLENISTAFREKRKEIEAQAENITNHIAGSDPFGLGDHQGSPHPIQFSKEQCEIVFENLMKTADLIHGGFGPAPKFPQTFSIRFLLQHYYYTGSRPALEQACLSLDKMIYGGIHDQLGGGFARYSTDAEWLAPHFEKMLYDNALLISTISEAYQITRKPQYRETIIRAMEFISRELSSPGGGFYSALDADSEGVEGKFYVWDKSETDALLGKNAASFSAYYDITEKGNWEGKNILRIKDPSALIPEEIDGLCRQILMGARNRRVRPQLDDKILTGWNALMITASCKAFAALGLSEYRELAVETMDFIEEKLKGEGISRFFHTYNKGMAAIPAFLDDYAYLIEAYIQLQEITGNGHYLKKALELTKWAITHFSEEETGYFFFTHAKQDDVIVRKKEIYDGAVPSGNSVMAINLLYLGITFDNEDWKQRSAMACQGLNSAILKYPGSFGIWATLLNALSYEMYEIVLSGDKKEEKHVEFLAEFVPNRIFQLTSINHADFPLLGKKPVTGLSQFFLCRHYTCQQPVTEVNELLGLMETT